MTDLTVHLGPLTLKNPIMTASGCGQYGLELEEFFPLDTLGAIVMKGLSLKPRKGNLIPRIAETPAGMLNAIGLQNVGIEHFIEETLPKLREKRALIIANLFGEVEEEYEALAARCEEVGIVGIELNLSCPNVKKGGLAFGVDPNVVRSITDRCRRVYQGSLWVKLTPNVTDIVPLARAAKEGGANAVTCINTLRGMAIDTKSWRPRLRTTIGGLSGPAIKPVALRCVFEVASQVDIPVVGCGGIMTAEDVVAFLLAGARAIQVGTLLFRDPQAPPKLAVDLRRIMETMGLERLDQLVGKVKLYD